MKHIIKGIEEMLKEYESISYSAFALHREKTATDIFNYVLSELEINTEALKDSERRGMCYE